MPGRDRVIDPVTRDYVKNETGGYETTRTLGTQLYHQVVGHKNQWWGDFEAGSDLYQFKHYGTGQVGLDFCDNALRTAVSVFISKGLARDLKTTVTAEGNRIFPVASMFDIQGAEVSISGVKLGGE